MSISDGREYSIHTVCRTCLSALDNTAAYDLFLVPGLAKKLCVCTSLSVEQADGFPKNLCTQCYSKLNDLHEFQKLCVDSVQKFQDLVASNTFACQTNFDVLDPSAAVADLPGEEEDNVHFDPLLNSKIEIIENEEDVFKMLETVEKEVEEVEKEDMDVEMEQPFGEFSAEDSFESGNDNDQDVDFQLNSSDDDIPLAQRSRSGTGARGRKSKAKTKAKQESDESSSSDDSEDGSSKGKAKRKRIPAEERDRHRLIDCHICHQKFKKAFRYEDHMKHHNDLLPFQCTVESCKKGFTTANGLRVHVEHAHTDTSAMHPCTYEGCNRSFARPVLLSFHMKRVHKVDTPQRDFPCTECDKVFRCPTALKKHMYKHTGEELPFACEICGKRFPINSVLRDHLLRHAGIKNHVCPYCGVGKTTRQEWNKHILTHTKEKKYECRQCDHASHNKQALANHVKVVHEKRKDFACQYCGKTFGKSHACKIHERSHTGDKCCECKICGKVFLFEKGLTKHLKTHEKRDLPKTQPLNPLMGDPAATAAATSTSTIAKPSPHLRGRVERVDIAQLAGTVANPIPSVNLPSWSPQVNFTKKEGQHICPDCGKGFNHVSNMKLHYKVVHQKVKDFCCRFCPKRFAKKQYLRHHEYIHTGEKPYECKVCGKHFRQEQVLKTHMKVHDKPPRPPGKPKEPAGPKAETSTSVKRQQPKNFEQYQDPAAERAAATAELLAYQIEENETKRKAEAELRKIQEAAFEQLNKLQKQTGTYQGFSAQKAEAEGSTSSDHLKMDHV
ncbi:zinc finger protein draculin [Drosophila kikkawai]|uniref:Zinc finger protein draculin n=1 Tax=Drosophila kikkawai TaxID=30033 RepID=A0A6P4I5L4_DROKI|nr:zinc finger protein 699 [Drosophila kikkawai]